MLALASKQAEALAVLVIIQAAFMAGYGVFMIIAPGHLRVRPRTDALTPVSALVQLAHIALLRWARMVPAGSAVVFW